ncbi:S-methyl-5-thioribose kinase [Ectobacillus ponti]|uniref:Methylthioribose kinase n=1 Tax=Ectobacillus ponti TaxID=2961894 RepID=A0AA41XCI4_9BACI|nr:S-methyl-5-thioribose kinase [Ectobacillus ponti]MCP8970819.1 S-methyl-5-thioribose kinase [Ectobacillus ponti]
MAYQPLTEETAIALAKEIGYFSQEAAVTCSEIGDGNLNLVFHIRSGEKGIIIKQALPYAKVVGESWPLSLRRATIESNALTTFAKYVPELVPEVYYHNEELAVTVMEDLSHMTISRKGLIEGEDYPLLSQHIGTFSAKTLFYTSDFGLEAQEKRKLDGTFVNPDLCKITEDLVFTDPFGNYETNSYEPELQEAVEELWSDEALKLRAAQFKYKFLTRKEALMHGDLHTGSIFATPTETKVIDPEFATFGPIGFDLGHFLANLAMNAIARPADKREILFYHIENTWKVFAETFTTLWETAETEAYTKQTGWLPLVLEDIFADIVGFAGCEIIRRTIGLAHVADLDGIADTEAKLAAKRHALRLGRALLLARGADISIFRKEFAATQERKEVQA